MTRLLGIREKGGIVVFGRILKKFFHWAFSTTEAENAVSRLLHFQWLTTVENGGTALCRIQVVEKLCFSTACCSETTQFRGDEQPAQRHGQADGRATLEQDAQARQVVGQAQDSRNASFHYLDERLVRQAKYHRPTRAQP